VREMLGQSTEFTVGEWVDGEAWRIDPEIGLFVIVERQFLGLVPRGEPTNLRRGEAASFRVARVFPDGKIELSIRGHAHEEIGADAEKILRALAVGNTPIGDKSSPEDIRDAFGLSKKAFKRAVGKLLKDRAIVADASGFFVLSKKK
jgi:predicted RNA-binding protein (virulence factor B family)